MTGAMEKPWKRTENKETDLKHVTNTAKTETNADNPLHDVQRLEEITMSQTSQEIYCATDFSPP